MSNMKKKSHKKAAAGKDLAAAVMQVARALPASVPVTVTARRDMRAVVARAPAALIALVTSMAEEGGGSVAGVSIDAAATRDAVTQVSHLRVGAAAARAIARHLEQEALALASGVAQRALSATTSLEALARTPEGRTLVAKATELRAAARGSRRRSIAKQAKATSPATNATPPTNGASIVRPGPVAPPATAS